jgi:hypothetical protein
MCAMTKLELEVLRLDKLHASREMVTRAEPPRTRRARWQAHHQSHGKAASLCDEDLPSAPRLAQYISTIALILEGRSVICDHLLFQVKISNHAGHPLVQEPEAATRWI